MQVLLDFPDEKAPFLMDVLTHISYVKATPVEKAERKNQETAQRPATGFGCMKGQIWMSDDFDEPLSDFAEYM